MAPNDPIQPGQQPEDEPIVYGDDAVIGRALRISLVGVVTLGAVGAAVWLLWPAPQVKPAVPPATVTGPAKVNAPVAPAALSAPFTRMEEGTGVDMVRTDGADGRKLLPETMGGGVAIADFNQDGLLDLAFADGAAWSDAPAGTPAGHGIQIYLNEGGWKFHPLHDPALAQPRQYMGLTAADVDGDGRTDLLVTSVGALRLLRNVPGPDGAPTFQDITAQAGLAGDDGWSTSAGFADLDKDGDLDLVVLHYVKWSPEIDAKVDYRLAGVGRAYGPPTGFPGAQLRVYEQVAPMQFKDATEARGLVVNAPGTTTPAGKALGLLVADLDNDGDLDLAVANDRVRKFLYRNDGAGHFEECGMDCGFAFDRNGAVTGAMGIDLAYLRADGAPFVAVGNFANEPTGLYSAPAGTLRFADDAIVEGISASTRPFLTFGLLMADFNLDGRPDMVQANGHIEDQIARAQEHQSYLQRTQYFAGQGKAGKTGALAEVPAAATGALAQPLVGRGAAWGDLDNDGDLDLVVAQAKGPPALFRNDVQHTQDWVGIELQQPGTANVQALGARVEAPGPDGPQWQVIMPVRSYLSSVPPQAWFGVPAGTGPVEITVTWPDGTREKHSVLRGKRSTLVRGQNLSEGR